jgi:hypothetical protein
MPGWRLVTRAEGVFLLLTTLVGQRWPENTKNYFWDPQMQLSFTNLVSTDIFIPVQAEQRVALHLPEQARASWVFTFPLPLSKARGRLRAEKKKRIKSHLFQIISQESGIKAYIDIQHCISVSKCTQQLLQV